MNENKPKPTTKYRAVLHYATRNSSTVVLRSDWHTSKEAVLDVLTDFDEINEWGEVYEKSVEKQTVVKEELDE